MSENLIPKRRFKEFVGTNPWEQRKLGELYNKIRNAYVGTATPYYVDNGHFYLESNNVKDGKINKDNEIFINDEFYERQKNKWLHTGDIVMVQSGHVGHCAVIPPTLNNSAAHALIIFSDKIVEIDPYFLCYELQNISSIMQINDITKGNTIKHILSSDMKEFVVYITEINEQIKIRHFFQQLDNLITLHQRKYDKLKALKSAYLSEMFPQDGEKVPKRRFVGFTDDWEQRKLGELGTLKNGMNFSKDAMGKGYPFVNLQDIFGKSVISGANLGKAEATDIQLKDYNLLAGDILFVRSSVKLEGVGETALVLRNLVNTTYSGFVIRFRDEYGLDNNFKRYMFLTNGVRDQIISQATNSANKNISQSVLSNLAITIPASNEQKQIGCFFSQLDNLITLHQRKLEKLKNLKKAYLNEMFV